MHNLIDNCSVHSIGYTILSHYTNHFLLPNMTSVLQPVECWVGGSFKCALHRLIFVHFLDYVGRMLEQPPDNRRPIKINEVITEYVAVKLIHQAWDLVPHRVILKAWLELAF